MEQLGGFIIALAVGVLVALTGHFLNLRTARKEREDAVRQERANAVRSMLSETETNLMLAMAPFRGRLVPFVSTVFDNYKGHIMVLPNNVRNALYAVHVEILLANAIVQTDLAKVSWGGGYVDNAYQDQCRKIAAEAEVAKESLEEWLKNRE